MSQPIKLARSVGGKPIWCREHTKADGRMLRVYGHAPHVQPVLAEENEDLPHGGEIRHHPLRNEWNVYAAHRQNRTFKPSASDDPLAPTRPNGPATEIPFEDFELAIFDNKFAAFHPLAGDAASHDGIDIKPAKGKCEVVVYGPEAEGNLYSIGQDRRRVLVSALLDRYENLFASGCEYVLPFENRGDEVGVTLHHPHGQIYGFGRTPLVQQRAVDAFANGYDLAAEIKEAMPEYGIAELGGVSAFVPRFARFPYELWLAPSVRRAGPWDCSDEELDALAHMLGDVTRRYDELFEGPAATMMAFHAAPAGGSEAYHFTVQFYPLLRAAGRVKYLASVEQHTGTFTVDVMPEAAARALRDV